MARNVGGRHTEILHLCDSHEREAAIRRALEAEGFTCRAAKDAKQASRALVNGSLAAILVEQGTWSVTEFLRARLRDSVEMRTPIIVLGREDEADELVAFALGADDYIPKDASPKRVVARVKAAIRRANPTCDAHEVVESGPLCLRPLRNEAMVADRPVALTVCEYKLLYEVVAAGGCVVKRSELMERVFDAGAEVESRRIDVHVVGLRKKLGPAAEWLQTVRAIGYVWREPVGSSTGLPASARDHTRPEEDGVPR